MKIGSLVELVDDNWNRHDPLVVFPVKNKVYTVREIVEVANRAGIRLEEIVNPVFRYSNATGEPLFDVKKFRELLPPTSIDIDAICEKELVQ